LGDLVVSIPLFRAFREAFPQAKIFYLGSISPQIREIFKSIPFLDGDIFYQRPHRTQGLSTYFRLRRNYKNKFDLLIDTQRRWATSFGLWLLKPKYMVSACRGFFLSTWNFPLPKVKPHISAQMVVLARILGIAVENFEATIKIPPEYDSVAKEYLNRFSGRFIAIIPGAGIRFKCWPTQKFAHLADQLISQGFNVVLIGSIKELDLLNEIKAMMKQWPLIPVRDDQRFGLELLYSAAILKECLLAVGNDCGGLHLATAVGCPVIAIYGPTNPIKSGPMGNRNIVIYKNFACSPCRLKCNRKIEKECLEAISTEEVMKAIEFILKDTGG
jgi:ADP-heptose:LPS heptosyltransferase